MSEDWVRYEVRGTVGFSDGGSRSMSGGGNERSEMAGRVASGWGPEIIEVLEGVANEDNDVFGGGAEALSSQGISCEVETGCSIPSEPDILGK